MKIPNAARDFTSPLRHLFLLLPLAFYWYTACRTPGWVDATLILRWALEPNLGTWVNIHNLFNLLGHLWLRLLPFGDPHYRLVLLCGIFGALAVHGIFLIGLEICRRTAAAVLGAATAMVCHTIWWHSTMIEVYTLNSFLTAMLVLCLIRYEKSGRGQHLGLAGLFFGLGISNHVLMGLFIVPILVLVVRRVPLGRFRNFVPHLLIAAGLTVVGASLYIVVFIRDWMGAAASRSGGEALAYILHQATGGEFKRFMFSEELTPGKKGFWRLNYLLLIVYNLPSIALFLIPGSVLRWWKARRYPLTNIFLLSGLAVQFLWSFNYFIWDMYAFIQPVILILIILVIPGFDALIQKGWMRKPLGMLALLTVFIPVGLYQLLPVISGNSESDFMVGYFRNYDLRGYRIYDMASPYWSPAGYVLNPNKRHYDEVVRTAEGMFDVLPEGSYLFQTSVTTDYPLAFYYRDTMGIRTDIRYHSFFGQFVDDASARREAMKIKQALTIYEDVYTVSLKFPERAVLDQLYLAFSPGDDIQRISRLSTDDFIGTFPGVHLVPVRVDGAKVFFIHRLDPESPSGDRR